MTISQKQRFLLVKAQQAILSPKHTQGPAQVLIDQNTGKIVEIAIEDKQCTTIVDQDALEVIELDNNQLLMPGLVDAHGKCYFKKERKRWTGIKN